MSQMPDFLPPIGRGEKRVYHKCRECGRVAFRDYIPYGLANPVLTMPCGHGLGQKFQSFTDQIPEAEAWELMRLAEGTGQ